MWDRCPSQGDMNESLFRAFNTLPDGFGHLIRLAHTEPDSPITIANYYESAKAKTSPPFDDFSYSIDVDDLIDEFSRWFPFCQKLLH